MVNHVSRPFEAYLARKAEKRPKELHFSIFYDQMMTPKYFRIFNYFVFHLKLLLSGKKFNIESYRDFIKTHWDGMRTMSTQFNGHRGEFLTSDVELNKDLR